MASLLTRSIPAGLRRSVCAETFARHSSTSSKIWVARQKQDPFVKQRNEDSFRSRSAYKLQEADQKYRFLRSSNVVVDLGAAPGGWSEYVAHSWKNLSATSKSEHRGDKPLIVAVDLLPMEPIPGVTSIKGNFLSREVYERLGHQLKGRAVDVVLSDMCENTSGNRDHDIASSLDLCNAALIFAQRQFASVVPLGPGRGAPKTLIMKFFADPEFDLFRKTCQQFFTRVEVFKPQSSRSDSSENYLVCIGYQDAGYKGARWGGISP